MEAYRVRLKTPIPRLAEHLIRRYTYGVTVEGRGPDYLELSVSRRSGLTKHGKSLLSMAYGNSVIYEENFLPLPVLVMIVVGAPIVAKVACEFGWESEVCNILTKDNLDKALQALTFIVKALLAFISFSLAYRLVEWIQRARERLKYGII